MDAPLGSVGLEETDELERLRRRAYGPDADIAGDAAAEARLSELEAARRRQLSPVVDGATLAPVPEPEPAEGSVAELDPAGGAIADSYLIGGAPAAPWRRRRRWFAILGGAIAALALIAVRVVWMSPLLAPGSTILADTSTAMLPSVPVGFGRGDYVPVPDYVLALKSVDVEADEPNDRHGTLSSLGISTDGLRRYEDFGGLNVWSGESRYGLVCLFVAVPVQGIREGFGAEGCSPEGLDAVADLLFTEDNLARFVLRDDQVDVYEYVRADDPIAPEG